MKVKLVRSLIQRRSDQVATAHSLGLKRIGDVAELPDNPSNLGMVNKIKFLLEVADDGPAAAQGSSSPPAAKGA